MRWTLGPSGLLRLAAMITLGLSLLLSGCASVPHDAPRTVAEEKDGWSRCPRDQSTTLTVVCLNR
ncbi:MAG TPA: hypothetical protein VIG07_14030 [Methylomirabilota bacterium]|jgi:hypothetical protein